MGSLIRFGSDGWKARLDGDFTSENVIRVADAAATLWERSDPDAAVYVGYDTRQGARDAAILAAQVLGAHQLKVCLSDQVIPIPALSWNIAHDPQSCGGLMITGSHYSLDYLGIKFRSFDGGTGGEGFCEDIERAIEPEPTEARGAYEERDLVSPYLQALCAQVDVNAIAQAGLRVVSDPMYGAATTCLSQTLTALGVEVVEIHGAGELPEDMRPEPVEPWVDECESAVVEAGAWAGLVVDGDADRVGAVDERGRFVSPHKIIALLVGHLVRNRAQEGRVVLGTSTSILTRQVAQALGCRVTVRPIGFRYIYEEMRKQDVLLGGEEAGGIGIPSHIPERDGMYVHILLCELMAKTGKRLGELVDELEEAFGAQSYGRRDLRMPSEEIEMFSTLLPGLNPAEVAGKTPETVSHMDGLRLEFSDASWLLLRPGATDSVVRVYAEAPTVELRDTLLEAGVSMARGYHS